MINVRPATAADVPAIVAIHRADLVAWKRWDAAGEAHLAAYSDLSPYERWLNGGVWLDESLYAPYLARLLAPGSGGLALVAQVEGAVRAVAEGYLGDEPAPYGRHLNISVLYTLRGHAGQGLGSALMQALAAHARREACSALLVTHAEAPRFYARHAFEPRETWRRASLPAQRANTIYQATSFVPADYAAVRGWAMPVGRYQSAREEWERIRPGGEPAGAEWQQLRRECWKLVVRQKPALLALDEAPRRPGTANVHLWLPPEASAVGGAGPRVPALPRQLVRAIRDRAARSGFAQALFFVAEATLPQLGPGWEDDGYRQSVWQRLLSPAGSPA